MIYMGSHLIRMVEVWVNAGICGVRKRMGN